MIDRASPEEAATVMEIIDLCKQQMRAQGSDQWNDFYPRLEIVQADADTGSLYVLRDGELLVGSICLNEVQSPEYANVPWRYPGDRVLVIHRLCVRPDKQSSGAARILMDFAESFAARQGYAAIRLDTYRGNARALAIYDKRGYRRAGQVSFPGRRLLFECFEKALSPCAPFSAHRPESAADCPA